jgi:hypothetical protein
MPFATPTWAMAVGAEMPFAKRTHKDSSTGMSQFSVMRMQQYRAGWLFCLFGLNPISHDPTLVKSIIADGCDKARKLAVETMRDVRESMGLTYS